MRGIVVHRFGPFELDTASRELFLDQKRVRLPFPQAAILAHLVTRAGEVVSRETLIETGWKGQAIVQNSIDQAISRLRKTLVNGRSDAGYIETVSKQGYRFTAPVERVVRPGQDIANVPLETQLAPFLAFVQGRTDLDTLDREKIRRAHTEFEAALRVEPNYALAHEGLAMACGLEFEAATPDERPDTATLELGIRHARSAIALNPASGEAWSSAAFVLHLNETIEHATAAAYRAIELEPESWRHALRMARVTWGEERLRAARQLLTICPGLALGHWFRVTVFISRMAFPAAFEELRLGCAAQDTQSRGAGLPGIGLHLLHAQLLAAHGRLDEAIAALHRELAWADSGQVYARECAGNTLYTLGAIYSRQQKRAEAEAAFTRALTIVPGHVSAAAALRGEVPPSPDSPAQGRYYSRKMDVARAQSIVLARGNRHAEAARVYHDAVAESPLPSAGWILAVEPTLDPLAHGHAWADALALIRVRAT